MKIGATRSRTASSTGPGIGNSPIAAIQRRGLGTRVSRARSLIALAVLTMNAVMNRTLSAAFVVVADPLAVTDPVTRAAAVGQVEQVVAGATVDGAAAEVCVDDVVSRTG